jgi:hypothetical protein
MSEQRLVDIHRILLDHSTLPVIYNAINNTLTYEGVDISEPLKVVHNFWRDRMAIACGVKKREDFKRVSYNFVHDKKPKIYLSGPITGREEKEYKADFNNAELYLTGLGYDVINPTSEVVIENGSWEDYMKRDLVLLLRCDYIYLLDGWEYSKGARLEYNIACDVGIIPLRLDENGVVV